MIKMYARITPAYYSFSTKMHYICAPYVVASGIWFRVFAWRI